MSRACWKPSTHIDDLRSTFAALMKPGRRVTETAYSHFIAQLRTCAELARELEEESLILESRLRSFSFPPAATGPNNVTPLRPHLRLVTSSSDGGDAA
jgi:hypothetical protein